jgi:hypothetical protein
VAPVELPETSGVALHLEAKVSGARAEVVVAGAQGTVTHRIRLGPWAGWRSLVGAPRPTRALDLAWSGLWSLAGLGTLAFWLRRVLAPRSF